MRLLPRSRRIRRADDDYMEIHHDSVTPKRIQYIQIIMHTVHVSWYSVWFHLLIHVLAGLRQWHYGNYTIAQVPKRQP